jgi:hypothetical protein
LYKGFVTALDLHTSKFIVSSGGYADGANYTTLASAIAAASTNDTIVIIGGNTLTENVTISKNLNIVAYSPMMRDTFPNVNITGKITVSGTNAVVGFFGIRFNTNADNSFLLSGSGASVTCQNCYFNASNANAISATGTSSNLYLENCSGLMGSTFTLVIGTNTTIFIKNCLFLDVSGTLAASSTSAGSITLINSRFAFPFATSGAAFINAYGTQISTTNTTCLTTVGTGDNTLDHCDFSSGTASAISVGAGTTVRTHLIVVNSSNANPITGSGSLFGEISYSGTAVGNNVTLYSGTSFESGINFLPVTQVYALTTGTNVGNTTLRTHMRSTTPASIAAGFGSLIDMLIQLTDGTEVLAGSVLVVMDNVTPATPISHMDFQIINTAVVTCFQIYPDRVQLGATTSRFRVGPLGIDFMSGAGDPNGSVTAAKGSYYARTDGSSTSTRAYINTNSATAWTAVTTAS